MDDQELTWLCLPGRPESLRDFRDFVLKHAQAAAIPDVMQAKIELVLEEVLLNVFHYASPNAQTETVTVGCAIATDVGFLVRIADSGQPFNPLNQQAPETMKGIEDTEVGGLGILLARKISSHMAYHRLHDRNILDIYFSPQSP